MKTGRRLIAAILWVAMSTLTLAVAEEHGTREEAKALVDAAVEHVKKVGAEQAFKDFTTDKAHWMKKDLYVIAFDMTGVMHANGVNEKMIGINHMQVRDPNGVMPTAEMARLVQTKGEGWVDYMWQHPQTKKMAGKSTYVKKLVNYDGWVGVGIHR